MDGCATRSMCVAPFRSIQTFPSGLIATSTRSSRIIRGAIGVRYQQRRSSDGDCNSWGAVYMGTYGAQGDYSRRRSSVSAVPAASVLAVPADCRDYRHRSVFVEWRDYEGSYGHEEVHY